MKPGIQPTLCGQRSPPSATPSACRATRLTTRRSPGRSSRSSGRSRRNGYTALYWKPSAPAMAGPGGVWTVRWLPGAPGAPWAGVACVVGLQTSTSRSHRRPQGPRMPSWPLLKATCHRVHHLVTCAMMMSLVFSQIIWLVSPIRWPSWGRRVTPSLAGLWVPKLAGSSRCA